MNGDTPTLVAFFSVLCAFVSLHCGLVLLLETNDHRDPLLFSFLTIVFGAIAILIYWWGS